MARPLRLQFPGAIIHASARGNEKRPTFFDDRDRRQFLDLLGEAVRRFGWIVTAYVLMSNHYHLLFQLVDQNLSEGLKWLDAKYAQWFNAVHDRVGHLFQGRPHTPIVDEDTYYREVLRYVVLNPVRAGMVRHPADYEWSSYRATAGLCEAPEWLVTDDVLALFDGDRGVARERYKAFVEAGLGSCESPWNNLVGQIYLGSEEFVERMRDRVEVKPRSHDYPAAQRELARPNMFAIISAVASVMRTSEDHVRFGLNRAARSVVAWIARYEGNLTNAEIAAALRLKSDGHVTNMIAAFDRELTADSVLRETVDQCVSTLGRKTNFKALTPATTSS